MINPTPIGSQSCLNAGGDHEELKILLKIYLITSRFNQELLRKREYIGCYKEIPREKYGPFDSEKTDRWPRSCSARGPRSHDPMIHVARSDPWWKVLMRPRVAPRSHDRAIEC